MLSSFGGAAHLFLHALHVAVGQQGTEIADLCNKSVHLLKQNGLIHASQMGVKGMADPSKVLKLHQQVKVQVISVDLDRLRIGLRLHK